MTSQPGAPGAGNSRTAPAWRNWAGNVTAHPERVRTPRSAAEVADEVSRAAADGLPIRMTGSGHSFTPTAATDGVLLRPDGLTAIRSIDARAGLVTVEAGCRLTRLNSELLAHGLSLANMGDIDVQTVAGAIQTGTHGTGRLTAGIAAQVAGLELVLADGTIRTCSAPGPGAASPADAGPLAGLFDAARVGLGALGLLTAVTFRVLPAFLLTAREEPMRWSEVIARLPELTSQNEHFEFFWFPHTEGCLTKRNNRSDGPARPLSRWRHWLDDEFLSNSLFGATCRVGYQVPGAIPPINAIASRALSARTYTDAAFRVFTSPRRVRFKEQEYAIPREHLTDVLREVRELLSSRDWRISFPIEVRVAPADEPWLSTAYGRDTAYIAIHIYRASPHEEYFGAVEAIMTAAGGRPHWGKLHTRDAEYLRRAYPRFDDFAVLRDHVDPARRFGNAYLRQVLGA
ncbi:MAG TPA: D-arabinono-1,4-lactone oxidase [Streptosporangiaceae bacterium]|nr:D-arabinono-1,4-lactone oxidase [Streptosporangiaceae bacterium]